LDKNQSPVLYGKLMRKLFEKYGYFRALEMKHKAFIQQTLLGKELYESWLQKDVKEMLASVQRKRQAIRLTEAELDAFQNPFII
jgi:hypothetical protein